jgi:hypothetical protein
MFCLETYLRESEDYKILKSRSGFKECAKIIENHSPEIVYVKAGEKIIGSRIIGIPPIPIGIDDSRGNITIPYTKPCYGTAVIELPVERAEIEKIRNLAIKN